MAPPLRLIRSRSFFFFVSTCLKLCLLCLELPLLHEARLDPNRYSSYKCQGGNQPGPLTPFRGSMNTHGEFDEKPLTLHKRTCELSNVCFVDGKLTYFMGQDEQRLVDRHDRIDGFTRDDFLLLGKRDVALNVDIVYAPVPRSFSWSPAEVAIYQSHSWSENFGHALLDDALGAFKLMHTHMRLTKSVQVIFHEDCDVIYGPGIVTGTITGQAALDRCRKFETMLARGMSSRKPLHLFERRGKNTKSSPSVPRQVVVSRDVNNLCFESVLVGASAMSLRHEHLGTAAIYQSFRRFFMSNLGIIDDNKVPQTTSSLSSLSRSHKSHRFVKKKSAARQQQQQSRHQGKQQLVTFFVKTHGQSHLDVDPESIRALAERVRVEMRVDVDVFDPATLTIEEQIKRLLPTTVLVTPMGGIDATTIFVSPSTSVIYVGQREGLMFSGHVYSHAGPHVLFLNATGAVTMDSIRSHLYKSLLQAEKAAAIGGGLPRNSFARP